MKKNRMMRLASVLLVCVMLTTSVISGTFAKYVTTAEGSDSARVAKWGITMLNTDDIFKANYEDTVVAANGTDKIVAPGTTGSTTYEVDGTPETDYVIDFEGTTINRDIYLGNGSYTYKNNNVNYVGMGATVDAKYYPLEWSVKIATDNGTVENGFVANTAKTFATLKEAMEALAVATVTFDANETCDVVVTIAWEWDFDTSKPGAIIDDTHVSNDVYDTILGDIMASNADLVISDGADYDLNVNFTVKMTATQID